MLHLPRTPHLPSYLRVLAFYASFESKIIPSVVKNTTEIKNPTIDESRIISSVVNTTTEDKPPMNT